MARDEEPTGQHEQDGPKESNGLLRIFGVSVAALILVIFGVGVYLVSSGSPGKAPNAQEPYGAQHGTVRAPADYNELLAVIYESSPYLSGSLSVQGGSSMALEDVAPLTAPTGASDTAKDATASASSIGYSETNVQVEGIDEGDIVKTDGSYIYALSDDELIIFRPDGASTKEISRTSLSDEGGVHFSYTALELYLSGSTVTVIRNEFSTPFMGTDASSKTSGTASSLMAGQMWTMVEFYDASNPEKPELIQSFGQSGDYSSSRLDGDVLYLISRYWLYNGILDEDPATFVPLLRDGGNRSVMAIGDIRLMPSISSTNYTVVTSYNVKTAERIDQKSVLGDAATVYMSHDNLYIASTMYEEEVLEPYEESVYMVEEHIERQATQLIRIGIDAGLLDVAAQCTLPGSLLSQFSLDEYEGDLRVAMTLSDYSYKILRDESYGVEVFQQNEVTPITNALYVFDPSLEVIGSLEGLAEDERIYSARFDGTVAYMVTYREMDPLFAIDLTDPTKPKVLSELKIPGFSTYLHPFGDGRLLGLGYEANGAVRDGMKLSMFDVSDPFDVSELAVKPVDTSYSETLDNHKAVLVDIERALIGFPGDGSSKPLFFIYGYDDVEGFDLKVALELSHAEDYYYYYGGYGTRGIIIGEDLYVYSGYYLDVFALSDFEKIASLEVRSPEDYGSVQPMPYAIE